MKTHQTKSQLHYERINSREFLEKEKLRKRAERQNWDEMQEERNKEQSKLRMKRKRDLDKPEGSRPYSAR